MTLDPQAQWTLARSTELEGVGLHSGAPVRLVLTPAPAHAGIRFVRTDLPGMPSIPALAEYVVDTTLSTTLGFADDRAVRVQTVEHLMASLFGLGITNANILIDGPELPALDGSALPFVRAILEAGRLSQDAPRSVIAPSDRIEIDAGDRSVLYQPISEQLELTYVVDYGHPLAGPQLFEGCVDEARFIQDIAPARTFCLLSEVERMREAGLAKGGTTENAVVIAEDRYLTPLRYPDEFVRHKVLDLLGDLALCGFSLKGQVVAAKAGHALHVGLAGELRRRVTATRERQYA